MNKMQNKQLLVFFFEEERAHDDLCARVCWSLFGVRESSSYSSPAESWDVQQRMCNPITVRLTLQNGRGGKQKKWTCGPT